MAHFRGVLSGNRGLASRLGTAKSGLTVEAQSWEGKVRVDLFSRGAFGDYVLIQFLPHEGAGSSKVIYEGPVSGEGFIENVR